MWFIFILVLIAAGVIHARLRYRGVQGKWPELALVYLLVGACGVAQIVLGCAFLLAPEFMLRHLHVPSPNGLEIWAASLLVGGGVASILAIWLRGSYLIGPTLMWAIFFAGATYAHLHTAAAAGHHIDVHHFAHVFVAHGLVSVILVVLLILAMRRPTS